MSLILLILIVAVLAVVLVLKYRLHAAVLAEVGNLDADQQSLWLENKKPPVRNFVIFVVLLAGVFILALNAESNAEALMALPVIGWLAATFSWVDRHRITKVLEAGEFPDNFKQAVMRVKAFEWGVLVLVAIVWTGFAFASMSNTA